MQAPRLRYIHSIARGGFLRLIDECKYVRRTRRAGGGTPPPSVHMQPARGRLALAFVTRYNLSPLSLSLFVSLVTASSCSTAQSYLPSNRPPPAGGSCNPCGLLPPLPRRCHHLRYSSRTLPFSLPLSFLYHSCGNANGRKSGQTRRFSGSQHRRFTDDLAGRRRGHASRTRL